ncbi:chloride channel protein [Peptococcaceae bacterium 1198_IL3148]
MFINANIKKSQLIELMLGIIVGALCGVAVYLFLWLLEFVTAMSFDYGKVTLDFLNQYYVILLPAIGGLLAGPLIHFLAKEARGHGVPEVMADVILKGGVIPPRVVLIKSLASIATIGFGGSAGRVGPIIHIGAGIGSFVGQLTKIHPDLMRSLVACGAAGGVAATFNAPIGGVMFALEVILADFASGRLMMIIVSAVTASIVSSALFNDALAITVPQFSLHSPLELILYGMLGIAVGLFAVVFIKLFYRVDELFSACNFMPSYLKPAVGGLLVGLIGVYLPEIFGVGYDVIEVVLAGKMTLGLLVSLLLFKALATAITLGSGGSGGVFAPILYLGAMLGGVCGLIFGSFFSGIVIEPMAYALAGMAGMLAASSFAPITGIILLFEMSNDYRMIVPLMITSVISYVIASSLTRYNIYTTKLAKKGLDINYLRRPDLLKNICVKDVMTIDVLSLPDYYTVTEALLKINNSTHHAFPVVAIDGKVNGVITGRELHRAEQSGQQNNMVKELLNNQLIYILEYDCLNHAAILMFKHAVGRLPVLDESKNLVGIISRSDIVQAYGLVSEQKFQNQDQQDVKLV